jgi:hypothetical protein
MNENAEGSDKIDDRLPHAFETAVGDHTGPGDRVTSAGEPEPNELGSVDCHGPELIAYRTNPCFDMELVPAMTERQWMTATRGFAHRCLPLLMANQAGWFILNSHSMRITWNGFEDPSGVSIEYLSGRAPHPASSHFGYGIVTWTVPYLFRTSPGFNLLARGPANWPKEGAYPLEGIVETDWSVATFTMNWRMTKCHFPVAFEAGEPICMLVPQRRAELEAFQPSICDIRDNADLARSHRHWSEDRRRFLCELTKPGSKAAQDGWQKDYFRGETPEGSRAPDHQTKLHLRKFFRRI